MATYSRTSPYYGTDTFGKFLDVMIDRPITAKSSDVLYQIDKIYEHRPDLLSYDLYGTASLWWVFAQRNPSVLKDPVFDLEPGIQIYLPKLSSMKRTMGI